MDPRFRLQPGMVVNPSGQMNVAIPLRSASGFPPSLSSGQGFHTVESLQGGSSVLQDGLMGYTQLSGYDSARGLGGRAVGMGQLGFDAAPLNVQQFMGQQAGMQQLLAAAPSAGFSSLMPSGYSIPMEMTAAGGGIAPGVLKQPPVYIYQPYVQPEIQQAPVQYVAQPSMVPVADAGLQIREYERLRVREDDRQRERDWKSARMQEKREEWAQERRRNTDLRREFERDRELDRRRALERRQDIDYENRVRERFKRKDKGPIKKGVSQPSALTVRQYDYHDEMKSKGPPVYGPRKVRCALCQIECNTQEMLGNHLAGKKHQARVKAEEQKKESDQPQNVEANKEEKLTGIDRQVQKEGVKATTDATKINANKGKGKAKVKRNKKRKSGLPDSNVDASNAEVKGMDVVDETAQELDKVKAVTMEPGMIEADFKVEKDEAMITDLGSGEEPMDPNFEGTNKESGVEVIKPEEEEVVTSIVSDAKVGGTELSKEVGNGNPNKKVFSNQDILSSNSSEIPVSLLVLGKRNLEAEPASAKKTRQSKNKRAGASPTVETESVRCELCKVTCRNATVYETHLKGEKHAERVRKGQGQTPSSKNTEATNLVDIEVAEEALLTNTPNPAPTLGETGVEMNRQPNAAAETT